MTRRGGRGGRNNLRGRRAQSPENARRSTPNRNGLKYNAVAASADVRKLPVNKPPRVLLVATAKANSSEELPTGTGVTNTLMLSNEEIKTEPIILTTNQNSARPTGQKKSKQHGSGTFIQDRSNLFVDGKGKNKQQAPAYSLKKEEMHDMDYGDSETMIGPKLPPEYEVSDQHCSSPKIISTTIHLEKTEQRTFVYSTGHG